MTTRRLVLILCATMAFASNGSAQAPEKILLKVSGQIDKSNNKDKNAFEFSLEALKALPGKTVPATNKYVPGKAVFKGPLLSDILKAVGAKSGAKSVVFEASDGYTIRAPITDSRWNVIVAYEVNGKALPPKEKGPLWVIYPLDEKPDGLSLRDAVDRMAWSLKKITVE
jgi:hypothetical protein